MTRNRATTAELLDSVPPNNQECELGLIGAVLVRPDVLDDVSLVVGAGDFYDARAAIAFDLFTQMNGAGKRIDSKLLASEAKKRGQFETMGEASFLADCIKACPVVANATYYAREIAALATKRALITAGQEIVQLGFADGHEAIESLNLAGEKISLIHDRHAKTNSRTIDVRDLLSDAMAMLDKRKAGELGALRTGYPDIDSIAGFRPQELLILAARTSMGKTALALNIAANVAMKEAGGVLFFSLEMSGAQVADRLLCSAAQVDGERMRSGDLSSADRTEVVKASAELSNSPLTIDDTPRLSIQAIAAIARRQNRKRRLAIVIVDYLQLIEPENPRDPREQQVARLSARLKSLARELNLPVLCLAQLNRQVETAADKRPRLSHLRESGAIEQDADVVMFVNRADYYANSDDEREKLRGEAELFIEKNRNGKTGKVALSWMQSTVTFWSASKRPAWS